MIKTNAILEFAEDLIHQKTETYCSELQRRILMAALQEERKTYDQLAEECGYSARYVKQDVAPKLWLLISQAVGEKVNKANVRAALEAAMRNITISTPAETSAPESRYIRYHRVAQQHEEESVSRAASSAAFSPRRDNSIKDDMSAVLSLESEAAMPMGETRADVLLVDDQPQNLKLLSDLLEEQGYEVQQAINGAIALQAIHSSPPDLILLDIHMPQMDGYTLCQHIKTDPQTSSIPVIFVSAIDEPWDKVKAFSAGGCDYITKPFKVVEVLARVENHLKVQQLQRALLNQNIKLQRAIRELQRLAAIDEITQVASRRRFDAYLLDCWHQAEQICTPLTLLLVQVDSFGFYGGAETPRFGDRVLHQIAQIIQQNASGMQDLVARYGTFTFAVLLPQQAEDEGRAIAQKILERVGKFSSSKEVIQMSKMSLNIGVSSVCFSAENQLYSGIGEFLESGEQALHAAKQSEN